VIIPVSGLPNVECLEKALWEIIKGDYQIMLVAIPETKN
jgi:hypothetical protein